MDAVASAPLDALLDDFAGSDPGLSAIVERFKVPFNPLLSAAHVFAAARWSGSASCRELGSPSADARASDMQAPKPAKAGNTLGALLQRLLYLLSHPEKAAAALESHGLPQPPMPQAGRIQICPINASLQFSVYHADALPARESSLQ